MQPQTRHHNFELVIILTIVIVLALTGYFIWKASTFHITGTNPSTNKVSTIAPYFRINFNQKLAKNSFSVRISPTGYSNSPYVSGKTLVIPFKKTLSNKNTYTVTIISITAAEGKTITNKILTFKPSYIPSDELPEDQQQAIIKQEDLGSIDLSDPILSHIPHQTTDYILDENLTPEKDVKGFSLTAIILLSQADMQDRNTVIATYKQEVVDYIKSLGFDPANYPLTYIIQEP